MDCERVKKLVSEYIDGAISPEVDAEIREHLKECLKCSALVNTLKATVALYQEIESCEKTPRSVYRNLHKVLREEWEFHNIRISVKHSTNKSGFPQSSRQVGTPTEIIEKRGNLILVIELPGVKKENIELMAGANSIEISGFKEKAEGIYYLNEIRYGEFFKEIELPCVIEPEKTKVHFREGLLRIKMPKSPKFLNATKSPNPPKAD